MKKRLGFICLLAFVAGGTALADGGRLILHKQAGPLSISVFSSPETLRVGPADLSVLVQETRDQSSVMDADVKVHLTRSTSEGISEVFAPAQHAKATNKLLYGAQVNLPSTGSWRLVVDVESKTGSAEVTGVVNVLPPPSPLQSYWPFFAAVPVLIVLSLLNRWLRRKREFRHP